MVDTAFLSSEKWRDLLHPDRDHRLVPFDGLKDYDNVQLFVQALTAMERDTA